MSAVLEPVVYKVCSRAEWLRGRELGELIPSADDVRDGFVHLSRAHQLKGTLERHFAGQADLVALAVRVERLPPGELRWEPARDGELFPHLYARLPVTSVEQLHELPLDASGVHVLPEGL